MSTISTSNLSWWQLWNGRRTVNWKQTDEERAEKTNPLDTIWFMVSYVIQGDLQIISQDWWDDEEKMTYANVWCALERWHVKKESI
jgi:hypothetical protein